MIQAGFSQLTAHIIKRGTLAEVSCLSKPLMVIPMVVTYVQDIVATGQLRPTDIIKPKTVQVNTLAFLVKPAICHNSRLACLSYNPRQDSAASEA